MASVGQGLYEVPQELVGKTGAQLDTYGLDLNDLLGQIGQDKPLVAGQTVTAFGEGQTQNYLNRFWKPTTATAGAESALAASKPITEQAYAQRQTQLEGEKDPLKARYSELLNQITGAQNKDIGATSLALSREYGKRGIPLSSGAYEQDLTGKLSGINQFYTGQKTQVGFEQEDKLREIGNMLAMLPIEKAKELNAIDQQIAQMKAQGASQQLQMAAQMYRDQKENEWRQKDFDLRQQEIKFNQQLQSAQSSYEQQRQPLELGLLQEQLKAAQISNQPKPVSTVSSGIPTTTGQLQTQFGVKPTMTWQQLEQQKRAGQLLGVPGY